MRITGRMARFSNVYGRLTGPNKAVIEALTAHLLREHTAFARILKGIPGYDAICRNPQNTAEITGRPYGDHEQTRITRP
jgi:hypothetical protein